MNKFKVLIPQPIAQEGIDYLLTNGCEVIQLENDDQEALVQEVKDCDAILVRTTTINKELLGHAEKLKIIARHGIGLDNVDIQKASERGVYVSNSPTSNINAVAEHVVGLMLNVAHRISIADKRLRTGDFSSRNQLIGMELKGKVLGLVGLGNIAKLVAEKCALGFGMEVHAYDPYVSDLSLDYIKQVDSLDEVLENADFLSLHVPYIPSLHHLIDQKELAKMKPGAFLINAARGGLVNESALNVALTTGEIAGAGLDCFEEEPPVNVNPLWKLDNVVVTPHMAAHTEESMVRMAVDPAEEIVRVKNGYLPKVLVNEKALRERV
ncbi:hydroxyacid dehydrogenase [Sporosarcina luteola]|uniref:hydroxyacid dehydrogenase n=1 Tax=Sporosarcina luteola TaxID=582850 RepID=UPI00203C5154|nr:hydroxyacid dehydrogenase [Sporosarcina luteola]MCM3709144.1 hydroxyacid dehydrogenase [Sporosarcina luteola]